MVCCVLGYDSDSFPFAYKNKNSYELMFYKEYLFQRIDKLIKDGYTDFISGIEEGSDYDFASTVLYYKNEKYRNIKEITLEILLPKYKNPEKNSSEYNYILSGCDKATVRDEIITNETISEKVKYMIDKSDMLFVIINDEAQGHMNDAVKYAEFQGKSVEYITLKNFIGNKEEILEKVYGN